MLGLEMCADDYLTKPYDPRELISRIRALRHGESLNLTPIEFGSLTFLARHRGHVLSRVQIVEAIWGYSPDPGSEESISVHVHHLREKIEKDREHPNLLLTIPGLGNRLASEIKKP